MEVRICVVLLVLGGTFALTGKGFYCRDPDTGKLHTVNSTWRSTTFCGNYTCRIKKKDSLSTTPFREFKISNVDMPDIKDSNKLTDTHKDSGQNMRAAEDKTEIISKTEKEAIDKRTDSEEEKRVASFLNKILNNITDSHAKGTGNEIKTEINKIDRYLNDKEIKIISDLLHSVKKSDLETVVDIYNLAQDIYKELDKKTTESFVDETISEIMKKENGKTTTSSPKMAHNKFLYSYDPIHISETQKTLTEIKDQERESLTDHDQKIEPNSGIFGYQSIPAKNNDILDMNKEGSDAVPLVYLTPKLENFVPTFQTHVSSPGYVKQPYYYEMSDFQRQSSYIYPYSSYPTTEQSTYSQTVTEKPLGVPHNIETHKPAHYQTQSVYQPVLLPYPYYQVRYNASGYPFNYFYSVNPYRDVYRKEYNPYYVTRTSYSDNVNVAQRSFKPGTLIDTLLPKDDDNKPKMPEWKTDSLSDDVIEDIRAHFESKNMLFKPLCLKKKVKLEKVGKVFKLDDFNREKRSTSEFEPAEMNKDEAYEVYIERTVCQSDVDPGFFRMGNTTAPYPACCPQRISR